MGTRLAPKADVKGRLLGEIAVLKSRGGFQGEAFVADNKFGYKGDGRDILQDTEKVLNGVLVPVCYKVMDAVRIIDPRTSCHESHSIACTNSL